VGVLLLQSLLPACSSLPWQWLRTFFFWGDSHPAGPGHVSVVMGPGTALGAVELPAKLLTAIAIAYCLVVAYFAVRFAWRGYRLSVLRRESVPVVLQGEAAHEWARCAKRFGIDKAALATSSRIFGPVTIGLRRKLLLLPDNMVAAVPDADLHTVIAHEFAHMCRNDFLKNLIYEALALPASYHPLFWLTRERIMETREMVCDQMAAEISGRNEYARSLLRLASHLLEGMPVRTPHAIGIFDANAFERRLMKLTEKRNEIRGLQRLAVVTACAAFAIATCGSTLALSMHVNAIAVAEDSAPRTPYGPINVSPAIMAENKVAGPNPKYPDAAKRAKIQGKVVLSAIIGKDGTVENLKVVSGPKELQESSLDAVRLWTYKPYLLNGEPVEVKTTINIIYSLAN
jgi:TonB family protein